jgi:hypothetical protein
MRGLNRRRLLTVVLAPAAALGSTALAVSIVCPSWLADGSCPVALIGLHFVTAAVVIVGFAATLPLRRSGVTKPGRRPASDPAP